MKKLVIVESPNKCKSISNYLGKDYIVKASVGHIRDLSKTGKEGLGIDIDNNFKPKYSTLRAKSKVIKDLKLALSKCSEVYLATDPDREGEAIAWHVGKVLNINFDKKNRVMFNEITKDKVQQAIKNPTNIDMDLVKAQETRRMVDRIIGFKVSKLVKKSINSKSAGRVQSVVLFLLVQRHNEITNFIPEKYYILNAHFKEFTAELIKHKNNRLTINTLEELNNIKSQLSNTFTVNSYDERIVHKKPRLAFTTSSLQQAASTIYGFSPKKTSTISQKLFEGKSVNNELTGLITYIRTDSTRLSDDFISKAHNHISSTYSKEYLGNYKGKSGSQDAHEAIRPTNLKHTPESLTDYLSKDELKLYTLIYNRTLASLMSNAQITTKTVLLNNNDYIFKASSKSLKFDGYTKVYDYDTLDTTRDLPKQDNYTFNKYEDIEKHTKPKPHYTEASLINTMEKLGIGRPSTYSSTITILKERGYAILDKKKIIPTEQGILTNTFLQDYFKELFNVEYTASLESTLDKISLSNYYYIDAVKEVYYKVDTLSNIASLSMPTYSAPKLDSLCPRCNSHLVVRKSKYGEFKGCSNFPYCKYIEQEKEDELNEKCPDCKSDLVIKHSRRGKFKGCSNYPKCKYTSSLDK